MFVKVHNNGKGAFQSFEAYLPGYDARGYGETEEKAVEDLGINLKSCRDELSRILARLSEMPREKVDWSGNRIKVRLPVEEAFSHAVMAELVKVEGSKVEVREWLECVPESWLLLANEAVEKASTKADETARSPELIRDIFIHHVLSHVRYDQNFRVKAMDL